MPRLTPELRAFVEAVRWEARAAFTMEDGEAEAASQEVVRAATALLSADAVPGEYIGELSNGDARTVPDAGAAGETQTERMQGSSDARFRALHDAVKPAPSRDEELEKLLSDYGHMATTHLSVKAQDECGNCRDCRQRIHAYVEALFARRVAEAEGETVGECLLRHQQVNRLIEVRDVTLTDRDWFTDKTGIRVRLVRAAQPGEVK